MDGRKPSYYAIIPSDVRYDDKLTANAKLLYGEISALIGADGYCFASNDFFATNFEVPKETISRWMGLLEKQGHIKRVIEKDKTGQIVARKIYLRVSLPRGWGIDENINTPQQKNQEGINQIVKETDNSLIIPPISPPEGGGNPKGQKVSRRGSKSSADVLPERFDGFWLFYRTHIPDGVNAGNRQKAIRAWDKLAPDEGLVTTMAKALAKQVKSQVWLSGIGVPHASTWLNNRGWEDDWGGAGQVTPNVPQQTGEEVEWAC